jgi:hypothetical protein
MILKPQDLVIALKVFTLHNTKWNQRNLAQSLGMSLSEVNGGIRRGIRAGLIIGGAVRSQAPQAVPYALQAFITSGVRYAFFAEKGAMSRGVPTGLAGAKLDKAIARPEEFYNPVWPSPQGKARGVAIKPLFKSIPKVIERDENRELYILLSLVDVIREGRIRESNLAAQAISKILKSKSTDA